MPLPFAKLQAAGNVYLAVDGRGRSLDGPALARAMTDDHFGVGSDGLLVVCRSDRAALRMRVFNSDGSEAEMSGNGLRLFTKFALDRALVAPENGALQIETGGGLRTVWPRFDSEGAMIGARIAMGVPELTHEGVNTTLDLATGPLAVTTLSIGNPHAVHLTEVPVDVFPLEKLGPLVQNHERFPDRVNFEVVNVLGRGVLRARIFERGEGETLSSGTGSTACAVAARLAAQTDRDVELQLRGGVLQVSFEGAGEEAWLDGPTDEVFRGEWPDESSGGS
jgi:diaminopimelate epimerase